MIQRPDPWEVSRAAKETEEKNKAAEGQRIGNVISETAMDHDDSKKELAAVQESPQRVAGGRRKGCVECERDVDSIACSGTFTEQLSQEVRLKAKSVVRDEDPDV